MCALIFGHVDGGLDDSGDDVQRRAQEVDLDQDVMSRGAVVVAYLDLRRRPTIFLQTVLQTQKVRRVGGPHSEVEGEAWFEVLCGVLEGHLVWRLHDFNACLLRFHQIAACADKRQGKQLNTPQEGGGVF